MNYLLCFLLLRKYKQYQTIISTLVQTQNNKTKKKHNFKFTLVHEGQEGQQMNSDIKRRKSY